MRTLTVRRKKSLIGCASTVYLYLSCGEAEATSRISGIPCHPVGKLKNGETLSLEITENPQFFFVAYSRTMPESYFASYPIPEGTQNVRLYTRPRCNPFAGNPFSVYPEEDPELTRK